MWLSERSSDVIAELEARTCHTRSSSRAVAGAAWREQGKAVASAWPGAAAGLTQQEFLTALADADASAGLQADVVVFRAFSSAEDGAAAERTLDPAVFLEAVDMAEAEAAAF